jgi:toxin ParE1/3/4
VARFRLSLPAQADLAAILATSAERWGPDGRRRYAALLMAAMRKVAAAPTATTTRERATLSRGLRSCHLRNDQSADPDAKVKRPTHIVYFRVIEPGLVEIVRILHERMEPSRHIDPDAD